MAAMSLPKPGTLIGPCAEPCQHTDCQQTRAMALAACPFCGKPIGYEQRFYAFNAEDQARFGGEFSHAVCLHQHMDGERENRR